MVFTKLSTQEKDAFFGLLDEYFQSRPELFGQHGNRQGVSGGGIAGTGVSSAAAASVVQRALATAGNASSTGGGGIGGVLAKSNNPYSASMSQSNNPDVAQAITVGRVAAASLAFSGGGLASQLQSQSQSQSQSPSQPANPPSLPHRAVSDAPASTSLERGAPGIEVDKLVTKKASMFSAFRKQDAPGVTIPPAFVTPKNTFGPPPVRRATSEVGGGTNAPSAAPSAVRTPAQRRVAPEPEPEAEAEEGEWAEALYDYSSEDPGDLEIKAGTRVLVTDKTSGDWWTGQVEGQDRQGLFPASYVKLL